MSPKSFAFRVPLTSEELIQRVSTGDPAGLGALYDEYAAALFRTAYRICGSRDDAEDVVHDLFVGLPEALRRYDERGSLGAWLTRIAVRLALMRARAERRRHITSLDDAIELTAPDRSDTAAELTELQQAVMALPDTLRAVFVLKQVEGYSHDEIGALLEISAGASRVRLARALEILRRSLR
jgi:RNA polymerase sigma-70 factor, ECF subfamily